MAGAGYRDLILAEPSLLRYYRLGETNLTSATVQVDETGRQSSAALTATPTATAAASVIPPDPNGSYNMVNNAASEGCIFPVAVDLDVPNPTPFSLEAWFVLDFATGFHGFPSLIFREQSSPSRSGYEFFINQNSPPAPGNLGFAFFNAGVLGLNLLSTTKIYPGNVYHAVATYDGTQARTYINGQLDAGPTTPTATLPTVSAGLSIGIFTNPGRSSPFTGRIDEVAVYNSALPAASIAQHYRAGSFALSGALSVGGRR